MLMKVLLILILLFLGQIKTEISFLKIINLVNFAVIGAVSITGLLQKTVRSMVPVYIALIVILISYFLSAQIFIKNSNNVNLVEPIDEDYVSDEMDYLKTFYLMEKGESFYQAHQDAIIADARANIAPGSVIAWRMPTAYKCFI